MILNGVLVNRFAVDGGFDYARIIGELDNLIELHEYEKDEGK